MNLVRAFVGAALLACSVAQAVSGREDVMRTFREYENLNADFVRSVSAGTGRNGKSYAQLRRESEAYAEGPLEVALRRAKELLCSSKDQELLAALLRLTTESSNSASEAPTDVLVQVAKCQPSQFRAATLQLSEQQRADLSRRSPILKATLTKVPR